MHDEDMVQLTFASINPDPTLVEIEEAAQRARAEAEANAKFERLWSLWPPRAGQKSGKARAKAAYLALPEAERVAFGALVPVYARYIARSGKWPMEMEFFINGQEWLNYQHYREAKVVKGCGSRPSRR